MWSVFKIYAYIWMEKGSTSILPDDEKPKYVFNEAKKMWIDIENPDEEKETPALPPRSTFAGQPEAAQSIIKNPIATGDSMKNKSSGKNFKKNSLVAQAILPDDEKPKYVFDQAKKSWLDVENPDEETETPALSPRSTFAGQPKTAQSEQGMRRQPISALWSEGQPFPGKLDSEFAIEMVIYDMNMPEKPLPPPQETSTPNPDLGAAPVQPVLEATSSANSDPDEQTEKARDPNTIIEDGQRTDHDWVTEASGIIWSFNVPKNEPCLSLALVTGINQTESTMSARTSNPMEPTLSSLEPFSPVWDPTSSVTDTSWEAENKEAIEYLFPSGLFEPRARPMMKHPDKIFPRRKEAEFDESGRPFHPLFYTVQPNFYQTLSDMVAKLRALDVHEDKMIREGKHFVDKKEFLIGEDWITADKLSMMLVEKLNDFHRAQFVKTIERLTNHNYGYLEKDYINGFRRVVASQFEALEAPDLMYNSEGRPFMTSYGKLSFLYHYLFYQIILRDIEVDESRAGPEQTVVGNGDDSCALSCDMCDAWLCIECIETSKSEYDLFNKMTRGLGSLWHCLICKQKGSGTQGITPSEIKDIIKSEIRCSFSTIEIKLQDKFEKLLKPISDRLTQIEKDVSAKCSVEVVKKHATTSLKVEFDNLSEKLKNEIKSKETANAILEDLVMKRKNLVVFGLQEDSNCSTKKSQNEVDLKLLNLLLFPLQFTGFMNKVDVDASVDGGGPTGQAGAVRVAVSRALAHLFSLAAKTSWAIRFLELLGQYVCLGGNVLSLKMRCSFRANKMEITLILTAGLLTIDPRLRERKKPGQEGARRKFTWKKR
ncbi:hypothetical protein QYM36_011866 [Artemia franciscana]|uniref:Uncharacterized protein n=1 Tax=Artemia franciscana TaxID=6661 RepID=A0AA88HK11_ARTSF|nr:hypothetical protein QYM36_011866 [Artemia franciscana]